MEWKRNTQDLAVLVLAAAPLIYLAIVWSSIPAIVPLHYNAGFEVDRTGHKASMWISALLLAGVSALIYLLFRNIHRIDPKRTGGERKDSLLRLGMVIVAFMSLLNLVLILAASRNLTDIWRFMVPGIAVLFAFMGNYMKNIRPNYFAGIRVPWTLNSEYNWRKTHQFAGRMWFWGGLAMAVITLLVPASMAMICLWIGLALLVIVPVSFSFQIFKKE